MCSLNFNGQTSIECKLYVENIITFSIIPKIDGLLVLQAVFVHVVSIVNDTNENANHGKCDEKNAETVEPQRILFKSILFWPEYFNPKLIYYYLMRLQAFNSFYGDRLCDFPTLDYY